jgi:biopolymer transport protein ExbB/TolQ
LEANVFAEIAASFQHGDIYLRIMLVLAFLGLAVIFERMIMLQFVYNLDFGKFLSDLRKLLTPEDTSRALSFCKGVSNTSLPAITRRALEAAETDPTTIRGVIEEETIAFLPKIEFRVGALMAFSTLILLVGVLGSIDSLWNTFHAVGVLDTSQKQASLGGEIASALNPTAFGLLLSILILVGHYLVRGMAIRLTERMHYGVAVINNLLVPADVPSFMPVAMPASMRDLPGMSSPIQSSVVAPATVEGANTNASSANATAENIRDEEEII